ncbi:protein kinase domain-containing protein [Streptosporangium sp. CA-135522]|uniref:protein kinase domain-containing protein n=1 Tax=Streptosporangium sp. CA-135522 TaxID=3240072 RepID=UPI003D89C02D
MSENPLSGFPAELLTAYEPLEFIARGGEADVFLCGVRPGDDLAAVKVYRGKTIDLAMRADLADERFSRHVPRLLGYGNLQRAGDAMIGWEAQEYFGLGSLKTVTAGRRGLPEAEVREITVELAACVAFWQSEIRYNHTDIKPDNILVRSAAPYRFVIGDFGGAVRNSASQEIGTVLVSRRYMAPEALQLRRGEPPAWWSVGVIVYELLTGETPYHDLPESDIPDLLHRARPFDLSAITDPRWRMLVQGLLTVERDSRWRHRQVLQWMAGSTPNVPTSTRRFEPVVFGGRGYAHPGELVLDMQDRWPLAVAWLAEGNAGRLAGWIARGFADLGFDPAPLERLGVAGAGEEARHLALAALAAHFLPDRVPRYKDHVVDDAGLLHLARGTVEDARALREILESGVLTYAARHECAHRRMCPDGCRVLARVLDEVPRTVAEVVGRLGWLRPMIERNAGDLGHDLPAGMGPTPGDMCLAWSAAAELTLRPEAIGGFLARIRKVKSDAPWWIRERRAAHDADVESVPGRGRIVLTHLLIRYAPAPALAAAPRPAPTTIGSGVRPRPPEALGDKARRAGRCRRFAVPMIVLGLLDVLGSAAHPAGPDVPRDGSASAGRVIDAITAGIGRSGLSEPVGWATLGMPGLPGALLCTTLLIAATATASSHRLWRRPRLRVFAYRATIALTLLLLLRLLATSFVPLGSGLHTLLSLLGLPEGRP